MSELEAAPHDQPPSGEADDETPPGTRSRVKDWLLGAAATVLLLVLVLAVVWWVVTRPAGDSGGSAASPPGEGSATAPRSTPASTPPPGLLDDELWLGDLAFEAGTVVTAGTTLRDVHAVGHDVVSGRDGIVAAWLEVDVTVPFAVVADELGPDTVVGPAEGGRARVVRTLQVLGRELDVVATGTVEVEAGRLVVEPTSIDIGGPAFLADFLAAVVRELVTIEHEIEGLPEGLVLTDVRVQSDGFRAHLEGQGVEMLQ